MIAAVARADPALDAAAGLYRAKKFPEAAAALEKIASTEPPNAEVCHLLGMALRNERGGQGLDAAISWLEKAVSLAPENALFLGDYGGTCLQLAERHHSYSYATRGRNAMEKAVRLDPGFIDARMGLMQFYARAPWPLGSKARARAQADEIARRNPASGLHAFIVLGRSYEKTGDRDNAREAYAVALKLDPGNADAAAGLGRLGPVP